MLILSVIFYPFLKGDFFLMLGMNSLIGRKFYLSETVKEDFPFPDDIRILDEDENNVIVKKGSKRITIDKIDLHRFYTTIKPDITFAIRYITDVDIRRSLVITVNEYESTYINGSFMTYFQCVDILGMYLRYMRSNSIETIKEVNKHDKVSVLSLPLDQDCCICIPKEKDFSKGVHQEKRFIVYGYKEDNLVDLFKFIDRKKWLDVLKSLAMSINNIYDLGIDKNTFTTKSILGFIKQIEKMSYPICNVMNIIPDTLFPENRRGEHFIESIYDMNKGIDVYPSILKIIETYDHGTTIDKVCNTSIHIDPVSIRTMEYTDYVNLDQLRIKNPKDNIVLVKTMKDNKIYVLIYRNKSVIKQIVEDSLENKESALSVDELKTFLTKKKTN